MNFHEPARDVTEQTRISNTDHDDRAEPSVDLKQEVLRGLGGVGVLRPDGRGLRRGHHRLGQ